MRVLFVAAELAPLVKVGGLGDVIEALPKALRKAGVQVSVVIPRYSFIEKADLRCVVRSFAVPFGGKQEKISLYRGVLPGTPLPVFFIDNPTYLSTGPAPYFEQTAFVGAAEEIKRFVFFSKAVHEFVEAGNLPADLLHLHDWHTGALATLRKGAKRKNIKTIFTIHNLGNQGRWDAAEVDTFFLGSKEESPFTRFEADYNFIAEGILNADWVTTVSPTYAEEILTKQYGNGLEGTLEKRQGQLTGILNGIDYEFFNPEKDQKIFENFSKASIGKKAINKEALGHALGLPMNNAPLYGLVSRLTEQKGIDLIIKSLTMFAGKHDARFVFLGSGVREYEEILLRFQRDYPERIAVRIGFDEQLAHRIYAASDFFLMPSRFEPCGLGQMIAMRYGALPIVRATGGLKDTVQDMKTGFVFEKALDLSLDKAMRQAYELYTQNPSEFMAMQKRAMSENFDFSESAKEYKKLYTRVFKKRR